MLNDSFVVATVIVIVIIHTFLIGYILGKKIENSTTNVNPVLRHKNKFATDNNVKIDDTKFVTDIRTDTLEKKYDSLGDVKSTAENISDSVNKLKNLKG